MRVLVHDYAGHPFQAQLSRGLAHRGWNVLHGYSSSIETPRGQLTRLADDPASFAIQGISLSTAIRKQDFFQRFRLEREYAARLAAFCEAYGPDVVLSANTPSIVQHRLMNYCQRRKIRLVNWVQDLYGLAAYRILSKKLPGLGHAIGRYFMWLDRAVLCNSDAVVTISEDFNDIIERWGGRHERIHTIHNWAPLDELPVRPRDNDWSRRMSLRSGLRFVYSGTLALKHNPMLLAALAQRLSRWPNAELIVVSSGTGADWLKQYAVDHQITNLRVFGFQPFEQMPDVLGSADVLVAILEPEAGAFSVPSKVLSYMCAARPLLLALPKANLAARIVEHNDAGLVASGDDLAGFVAAGEQLATDAALRTRLATNARRYAEANFDLEEICQRFAAVLAPRRQPVGVALA